ncbi:MlaE family ABC transporter permease [Sulfurisoma sediminicola]|uniref:Phospholipid/cholesterol/gamma-HCH transport system permease protein n=1 Tax=Sulfurisoma sediminicola TaxID=1381557 RepID=A0A497XEM4_9PROT|nr:ABC transporter permease [Sulfurisoma sediminicola]RLJ65164.1 phospholipid/cholesterol/gamma-HCH transport system permease protein [Sulfurisoma sediminicola]
MAGPLIQVEQHPDVGCTIGLSGRWTLAAIADEAAALGRQLAEHGHDEDATWDCLGIEALDSAGAMLLWRAWGRALPELLLARSEHLRIFERIDAADHEPAPTAAPRSLLDPVVTVGLAAMGFWRHIVDFVALLGQIVLDVLHLLRSPQDLPRREISANLYKSGVRAMPVTALVGFLIGIVLSYLSALQLRNFGADVFIVNILGMGIIRELGPVLVALLVAGRSGSAMTAQLGVMRVTEEIDALATMGVSKSLRLVFPKVVALAIAMPLLTLWTTAIALIGGMVSAQLQLDISYGFFLQTLPRAVPAANLWIGLAKGLVFGILVALVACHFGLRVRPNTESLSANTTASVVTAITLVIIADAIFAVATRSIGLPRAI